MTQAPSSISINIDPAALAICRRLAEGGHQAFIVGGAVRDSIAGRKVKDWDIATSARPDEVVALFPRSDGRSSAFGTVIVPVGDRRSIEVTTFRAEREYSDGRRPDRVVLVSDLVEDLARRDLTINAIAYDPLAKQIIDPHGGAIDLAAGLLRAVGDPAERLAEDPLRAVRIARFIATFGYQTDPGTVRAASMIGARLGTSVSAERLGTELIRIVGAPNAAAGLLFLAGAGLMPAFFPTAMLTGHDRWSRLVDDLSRASLPAAGWLSIMAACLLPDADAWRTTARRLALGELEEDVSVRLKLALFDTRGADRPTLMRRLPADTETTREALAIRRLLVEHDVLADDGGHLARRVAIIKRLDLPRDRSDLAIDGHDLLKLGFAGRQIGAALEELWIDVVLSRLANERPTLLARAARLAPLRADRASVSSLAN